VIVPLLQTGGRDARAEVSGKYPSRLVVGEDFVMPVAVDNTSGAVIRPLCIAAQADPGGSVEPISATFQGLDTVPFRAGRACAGELSGQEVVSVRVTLRPQRAGLVRLSLVAAQGGVTIGPELRGTVEVVAA